MTRYRTYDYAIGRFWQMDPLADSANQENQTPYHYVRNNPINYNDPLGDCDICIPLGRFKRKVIQLYNEWRNGTDAIPGGTQVVNNGSPGPEASQTISLEGHDETEQPYTGVADRWGSPTSRAKSIAEAGHRINQIIPNELTDLDNGGDQEDSNQSSSRGSVKDGEPVQFLLYSNEGLDISGHMMYDSIWENVDPITGDIDTTGTRTRPGRIGAGGPVNMTKEMIKDFLKK